MDTINITPAQNSLRSIALVTGVVIAIICAVVSLKNFNSVENSEASALGSLETPSFAQANFLVNTASKVGHAVIILNRE